jgi:hypothetical protein
MQICAMAAGAIAPVTVVVDAWVNLKQGKGMVR